MPYTASKEPIFRKCDKNSPLSPRKPAKAQNPVPEASGSLSSDRNDSIVFLASLTAVLPSISVSMFEPTPLFYYSSM